jgi:DNA repair protein RecN (Recombination protein N)
MLHELHITDLGVIADVDLGFDPGLNVLTGETGAGKTMVVVALGLALGRRGSGALVRQGAAVARVQGRFDATAAARREGWDDDGSVVLARAVDADGRSTARVGGQLTPVSVLERLGTELVEMHGQHGSTLLRSSAEQTAFLDRFAGTEHLQRLDEHVRAFTRLAESERALDELDRSDRDREREADVLAFQIAEIEAVSPRAGEMAQLEAEALRLTNVQRLLERTSAAETALSRDDGAAEATAGATAALEDVADVDASVAALAERARALREEVAQLARDVRDHRESLETDPVRLEETNARIAAIRALFRKYGDGEEAVEEFLSAARERSESLATSVERRAALEREVDSLGSAVEELGRVVSAGRAGVAPRLASAIADELRALGMPGAVLAIELIPGERTASGIERAEFAFAGGPGQRPLPLAKVASGGELSRVMLACRTVLVDADAVATLVFDEVDAGIGGAAGAAVGQRLAALARHRQILVVTHLPQIASFADRHLVVEKTRGTATVTEVDGRERIAELSRMLAGLRDSEAAAAHAEELLAEAVRVKGS